MKTLAALVLLSLSTPSFAAQAPAAAPDTSAWIKYQTRTFAFSAPPTLVKQPVRGIDGYLELYKGAGLELDFEWSVYSPDCSGLSANKAYREELTTVSGRQAKIATFVNQDKRLIAVMCIPNIAPSGLGGDIKLAMEAVCDTPAAQAAAVAIFKTVQIP